MTPTWRIHHPDEHTWALVPATNQKKRAHQWWLTGARLKAIREKRAVKVPLHLHRNPGPHGINSQTLSPRDRSQTPTQGTHDAPRNEQQHIPHTGEFHPSLHSPLIPFISVTCWQGLLYRQRYRYKNPLAKENPHLFSITSQPHWAYPFTNT